jgi:hypothetical protein
MQIVINIDEKIYKRILPYKDVPVISNLANDFPEITHAIANGVPIPTGHGRLIDAEAFIKKLKDISKMQKYDKTPIDKYTTVDDVFQAVIESLKNEGLAEGDAPTIIEADKAESEES